MDPTADPIVPSAEAFRAPFSPPESATSATGDRAPVVAGPGTLGIRERRSWRTWQLIGAGLLTFVFGLYIESLSHAKAAPATTGSSSRAYTPPPPSGASTTLAAGGRTGSSTTVPATGASGASTTTAPASTTLPTTTVAASGTPVTLVPRYQAQGNWTSPSFTITGGTWNIGWAYQCTPPPASGPGFQVTVGPSGTTAVTGTNPSGQGVTPVTSTGAQTISVQAPAGCVWVVKVTGVGTA